MEDQIQAIIQEKILSGLEAPLPSLTRRDGGFPLFPGKAKVVVGMRRAGKTSFLHQIRADLIEGGRDPQQLVYFNFEDERLAGMEAEHLRLIPETHIRLFPNGSDETTVLFLDEIQVVSGWETFARRLLDEGRYELYLSGSSAKLLSREVATSMRGRGWEITIRPFSFIEWLRHHGHEAPEEPFKLSARRSAQMDRLFAEYLETGGFPEAQRLALRDRRQLLQGYVDVVLLRDVIERYGVSNVTALRWMVRRLLGNPGGLFSITKFESDLKSQGIAVSRETLYDLLGHLEDAFLLQAVPIATDSEKRKQVNPRKVYPIDHGVAPVFDRTRRANTGHALEVAVYNELLRRGAEVAYIKTKSGYEVDFRSRGADGRQALVQVSASIDDSDTRKREARALQEAAIEHPSDELLILTAESRTPFPSLPDGIKAIPAWAWMIEGARPSA